MAAILVAEIGYLDSVPLGGRVVFAGRTHSQTQRVRSDRASGQLTKQGSRLVRWAVIEGTVRYHGGGKLAADFRQIAERRGMNKATVDRPQGPHARLLRPARRRDPLPRQDRVNPLGHGSPRARKRHDPYNSGEVDDLLEPEESGPERTMLRSRQRRNAWQPSLPCPRSTAPWCGTRQPNTCHHTLDLTRRDHIYAHARPAPTP
jgi:hypothetical protein